MRPIFLMMASVAALSVATPASAQWGQDRTSSQQLQVQIDTGISQGRISRRESVNLREDLNRLVQLERRFSSNGVNRREHAILMQRSTALANDIRKATRDRNARSDQWGSGNGPGYDHGNYRVDSRFAGTVPSDRFNGDIRIGQHVTTRIVTMPAQYRNEYVDNDQVYYGYDNGRIYQIDRRSRMILALLDLARR